MQIRRALISDARGISEIYNHYIENTVITFEENAVSIETMASRIETISGKYPYLVLEHEDEIIGYAYATEWRIRSAYRFSAEVTIYLEWNNLGKGFGSLLFGFLIDELKKTPLHSLVGGIALPNNASVALHEKFGFRKVATFEEIGYKFGRWIDVGYWELKI